MKIKDKQIGLTIKDEHGNFLAYERGEKFTEVLEKAYRRTNVGSGVYVGLHDYYISGKGFPFGTHHIQMSSGGGVLDPKIIVQVE